MVGITTAANKAYATMPPYRKIDKRLKRELIYVEQIPILENKKGVTGAYPDRWVPCPE